MTRNKRHCLIAVALLVLFAALLAVGIHRADPNVVLTNAQGLCLS